MNHRYLWSAIGFSLCLLAASLSGGCATGDVGDVPGATAACGDGVVQDGEACDDGGILDGDGCDRRCVVESGFSCEGASPSVCEPLCGNGALDDGEACDGASFGDATCQTLGAGEGALACSVECMIDVSGCVVAEVSVCGDGVIQAGESCDDGDDDAKDGCSPVCEIEPGYVCTGETSSACVKLCGNGSLDEGEACDGGLLGGKTCVSEGFAAGQLGCAIDCTLNIAGCMEQTCGDGVVQDGEACDDGAKEPGDGCAVDCSLEQGFACEGAPSVCEPLCGNGEVDEGEACDGALLGGKTCADFGAVAGALACSPSCEHDASACVVDTCDNGQLDAGEVCDGALLGGKTCVGLGKGYIAGSLSCSANCQLDESECAQPECSDGILSAGEECDDADREGGDGCDALCRVEDGFICDAGSPTACVRRCGNGSIDPGEQCDDGGSVGGDGCSSACVVEPGHVCDGAPSVCTKLCGNALREGAEQCDGADFGGQSCVGLGYAGGALGCDASCEFDETGCLDAVCDNGALEVGEVCDSGDFGGQTCVDFGFQAGALSCGSRCDSIETTGCLNCTPVACQSVGASRTFETCNQFSASIIGRADALAGATIMGDTTGGIDDDDTYSSTSGPSCLAQGPDDYHQIYVEAGDTLTVTATSMTSGFDISLAIYEGQSCSAKLTCEDSSISSPESLTYTAVATGWLSVAVDGALSSDEGVYVLDVSIACGTTSCCCF